MASPDRDHLQAVPDEQSGVEAMPGLEAFVERLGPEAGRIACAGANMLFDAVAAAAQRPTLNAATRAELERQGVDMDRVVATDGNSAIAYNSAEQATVVTFGPEWKEALRIMAATRRVPR